jgi:hypothetical protein
MVTGPDRGPAFMSGTPTFFRLGLLSVTEWNRHEPDVTPAPLLGLGRALGLALAPASARATLRWAGREASTTQATATAATTIASPAAMNAVVSVALVRRPLPY